MMQCMSEEDITKSKNGVDPQEKEFDQQQTEIEELRAAISDLKKKNDQLKEDLRSTARLAHNIYMYVDSGAEDTATIQEKILSLFKSLHKYLEL